MTCTRCKQDITPTAQPYYRTRRGSHHAVCPPQPSEAQIQETCTQLLEHDGWRPLITNPCSDRARGAGFGQKGMADALYMRSHNNADPGVPVWGTNRPIYNPTGDVMWIEWKAAKGRAASHQLQWHQAERARGFLTLIAGINFPASIEGFWDWYCKSGLKRKDIKLP